MANGKITATDTYDITSAADELEYLYISTRTVKPAAAHDTAPSGSLCRVRLSAMGTTAAATTINVSWRDYANSATINAASLGASKTNEWFGGSGSNPLPKRDAPWPQDSGEKVHIFPMVVWLSRDAANNAEIKGFHLEQYFDDVSSVPAAENTEHNTGRLYSKQDFASARVAQRNTIRGYNKMMSRCHSVWSVPV